MAFLQKKNNAKTTITNNPLTSGGTSVTVATGKGALFPASGDFMVTIWDATTYPDPTDDPNMEICRCTSRSTDTLTVTRAQESTSAVSHASGSAIALLITALIFNEAFDQNLLTTSAIQHARIGLGMAADSSILLSSLITTPTSTVKHWQNQTTLSGLVPPDINDNFIGDTGSVYSSSETLSYRIYAYRSINGTRVYSSTYVQADFTIASSGDAPEVDIINSSNDEGYRVLRNYNSGGYVDYWDIGNTSSFIDYGVSWTSGSTVTPTTATVSLYYGYVNVASGVLTVYGLYGGYISADGIKLGSSTGAVIASTGNFSVGTINLASTSYVTGTLATTNGGTGLSSYAQGDLLYYNSGAALSKLAKDTNSTRYLSNQGTSNNPSWSLVNLSNGVTGTLGGGNGGTGITSFGAANRIPYAASTTALTTSASLTWDGTYLVASNFKPGTKYYDHSGNGGVSTSRNVYCDDAAFHQLQSSDGIIIVW